jgi:UDP-glucuronate 4-epimerase
MRTILITGAAGFIGFHLSQKLLAKGEAVIGIDNLNDYYDVSLKQSRLNQLLSYANFQFFQLDISDRTKIAELFEYHKPTLVIHLAAQAGVRYSLTNPHAYIDSNLVGFGNILEGCRQAEVKHLVFASSSSVYGANTKVPFAVSDRVDTPISLYAATKKANELMAYILKGTPIKVFNNGNMRRDFTYIDDIVEGIIYVMNRIPQPKASEMTETTMGMVPYALYNIGNNQPVNLLDFIAILETQLGITAKKEFLPLQPGDLPETYADIENLIVDTGFRPNTSLKVGLQNFVNWYRTYYSIQTP